MKNGKQIVSELQARKKILIQQLNELNQKESNKEIRIADSESQKNKIERELVEIMDRLTQLNYIFKG